MDEDVDARTVDRPSESSGWFGARLKRTSGGFYWRRERLTRVIAFFTVLCVVGEVLLAIATPHTLRQAKKTLSGLDTMTAISADVVYLHSSFVYEQELFVSYKSRLICESNRLNNATAALDDACTLDNVQEVRNRLDGFFLAVDELASAAKINQLNCSHERPFWKQKDGWLGVAWACKHACWAGEWSAVARSTVDASWSSDSEGLTFAIDFADNVKNTLDLMISIEDAVNAVMAIVGIGKWIEADDEERKAEAKVDWSKVPRAASKGLGNAIQCFETFQNLTSSPTAAPTTPSPTPSGSYTYAPTSMNMTGIDTAGCRDKKEFRDLQQATKRYISISNMGEKMLRFVNKAAQFLSEISVPLVITLICLSAVAHVLIAAFLHRAVYTHEIRTTLWRSFLYAERRMMPQRYSQRASRRASSLGATPDRREPTAAGRAADCVCDSSFMVRFWIVYVVSNVLLLGAVALVVLLLLLIYIGYTEARCELLYRQAPAMKSLLRIAKKDSEGSCFTRLSSDADKVGTWTRYDVEVDCEAADHRGLKQYDNVIVTLASSLLLIGNWFLCQWLPAAFGFSKTSRMCDRLHEPVQETVQLLVVDAEAAPGGGALVEKADGGDASPPRDLDAP